VSTVSVGSTPTAHAAEDLTGVTELRAGNYVFFDLVMAGLGVCQVDDLALSVVVTVIGTAPSTGGSSPTAAGWQCPATAAPPARPGPGLRPGPGPGRNLIPGLVMSAASQEHGTLTAVTAPNCPTCPSATRLRILPNHACATAAQHRGYHVIDGTRAANPAPAIQTVWNRISGW